MTHTHSVDKHFVYRHVYSVVNEASSVYVHIHPCTLRYTHQSSIVLLSYSLLQLFTQSSSLISFLYCIPCSNCLVPCFIILAAALFLLSQQNSCSMFYYNTILVEVLFLVLLSSQKSCSSFYYLRRSLVLCSTILEEILFLVPCSLFFYSSRSLVRYSIQYPSKSLVPCYSPILSVLFPALLSYWQSYFLLYYPTKILLPCITILLAVLFPALLSH